MCMISGVRIASVLENPSAESLVVRLNCRICLNFTLTGQSSRYQIKKGCFPSITYNIAFLLSLRPRSAIPLLSTTSISAYILVRGSSRTRATTAHLNSWKFNVHIVLLVQVLSYRIVQSIKAVKADPNPDPSVPSIHNHPDDVCTIYNLSLIHI